MSRSTPRDTKPHNNPPGERFTPEALRALVIEHNREVLLTTALSFLGSIGGWLLGYGVVYWLSILFLAVVYGVGAPTPQNLPAFYMYAAVILVFVCWLERQIWPQEKLRDKKPLSAHLWDLLLAIPRATLSVPGNVSAWLRLSDDELVYAVALIERMTHEGRLPLYRVAVEIPDRRVAKRIVLALQMIGIIHLHRDATGAWLSLASQHQIVPAERPQS